MGNSAGGQHRPGSASGELSDSALRNPLQRQPDVSSPSHNGGAARSQKPTAASGNRKNSNDDDRGVSLTTMTSVPQPPQPPSSIHATQNGNAADSARARRVSVAITSEMDPPHQTPHRLPGFRRVSNVDSLGSNNESFASHVSSLNGRPRLTLTEAREILLSIFFPRQGQLECIASGFITAEHYALMRGFWVPFLNTDLRDKWYLDAVMLSVLGKDRWRSSRQQKEIIMSVAPSREQVSQLNEQRQEYNDQLRERLLDLCGSLVEPHEHHTRKTHLQSLLEEYQRHKESNVRDQASNNTTNNNASGNRERERVLSRTPSGATSSMQHQELLSLSLMRLQTTVSTSFDCFDLLASRIPTAVVSSLPSKYFLNSCPVVYDSVAFQEKKVGDIDSMSFFMSIESRRRMLNGHLPDDAERLLNSSLNELGFAHSFNACDAATPEGMIASARQFYTAVRHAGLVVTTACSSMVLTVMFQLAEVLRARQVFRDNRAKATQRGITLEQLVGRAEATIRTYSGKPTDDLEELKRYAITDEMSLAVLTRLLIARFRKENQAKAEKLRKRYPNLFAYLEAIAPKEEQDDFDVTRLLSGMVLKLMFLTGGGQRSIVADDRRVPGGLQQVTDDVALNNMLEVPILNRICWVACMMGMPIMSNHGILTQKHQGKPLTYIELDECCGVMRMLFQAVGALPSGNACPHAFKEWFPLFPFYAVNAEGKRVLMYLYMAQVSAIQRVPLTIQKDMTLLSFASALQAAKGRGRVDIANYFFDPTLTVGVSGRDKDGDAASQCSATLAVISNSTSAKTVAHITGPASPLAPKSIAGTLAAKAPPPGALSVAAVGHGGAATRDKFQYMTSVNAGSPNSASTSKASPTKHARTAAAHSPPGQQKLLVEDELSTSTSSSASLSCSTLLEDDRDIDVYTCVNPQTQLYMRCSHEATLRRHRATELTPSVAARYFHSAHEMQARRPDIAPALLQAVPKLMPSEGFLLVRWTSTEPLVTFCAGDIVSAMAERVSHSSAPSSANPNHHHHNHHQASGSAVQGATPTSPSSAQTRSGSARYFTNAVRPSLDSTDGVGASRGAVLDDSAARMTAPSPRAHTVTIDDAMAREVAARAGLSTSGGGNDVLSTGCNGDDDLASCSSGSFNPPERTRVYQGLMHEFLGVKEKVSRRLAVRWSVVDVLPCTQLVHRSRRLSSVAGSNQAESYRSEVVLHVAAVEMPVSFPLRILTIGHERAAMSVFTFVSPDNDSVCWANPRLIEAIVSRSDGDGGSGSNSASATSGSNFLQGSAGSGQGPSGILCHTEEELHNVFFSIGVLLSNAIVNGVYFGAPIAPLAFLLMKKALSSGDYSFKSFMWLEPADGNLLSPALVLNSAYEILTMTEPQYVAFLQSRGLAGKDASVFPVMHSLADEVREDRAQQQLQAHDESRRQQQQQQLNQSQPHNVRGQESGDSTNTAPSTGRDRSSNASQATSSMQEYMKLIQQHNRRGSTFRRSQGNKASGSGAAGGAGMPHTFLMATSVPVQDRLQGYRTQQGRADASPLTADAQNLEALYSRLPSRREYLFLYLVNDLTWGSVRRDGIGEKNKELWVSMARGFMTSAVAKSPLMSNCCSRIIREVLCVPGSGG